MVGLNVGGWVIRRLGPTPNSPSFVLPLQDAIVNFPAGFERYLRQEEGRTRDKGVRVRKRNEGQAGDLSPV